MKLFNLQIDDDLHADLMKAAKSVDPNASASQFVRDAIREKLARDVYGVVSVPTPQSIRKGIVGDLGSVSNGHGEEKMSEGQRRFLERKAEKDAQKGKAA